MVIGEHTPFLLNKFGFVNELRLPTNIQHAMTPKYRLLRKH